jgi:hypothetical protein
MKNRFQPGEQVVVSDAPDATIYTIQSMHLNGVVRLTYWNASNQLVDAGEFGARLCQYPNLQQLENAGELDK